MCLRRELHKERQNSEAAAASAGCISTTWDDVEQVVDPIELAKVQALGITKMEHLRFCTERQIKGLGLSELPHRMLVDMYQRLYEAMAAAAGSLADLTWDEFSGALSDEESHALESCGVVHMTHLRCVRNLESLRNSWRNKVSSTQNT